MGQSGKPSIIHMAAYFIALTAGGKYGWQYGHDVGGTELAVVFGIGGAIIASTLVGVIAYLLGYRL